MFSESSTGFWAVLQLPYFPSKQGEHSEAEYILQNLFHNLTPQTVVDFNKIDNLCFFFPLEKSQGRVFLILHDNSRKM